jgi:glycosyltransferase involved in cell wall biosynthesis
MRYSVAIATYNGERYIEALMDSINAQSVRIDEVVVYDDGSIDSTLDILRNWISKNGDLNVRIIHGLNVGHAKNFQRAIEKCDGDIIFLADQDDVWEADKVKTIVGVFNHNADILAVYSDGFIVDRDLSWGGRTISSMMRYPIAGVGVGGVIRSDWSTYRAAVVGATLSFRRSIAAVVTPFPDGVYHHDSWISKNAALAGHLYYVNSRLIKYRQHSSNVVGVSSNPFVKLLRLPSERRKQLDELKRLEFELELIIKRARKAGIDIGAARLNDAENWLIFTKSRISLIERPFKNYIQFFSLRSVALYFKHSNGFRSFLMDRILSLTFL